MKRFGKEGGRRFALMMLLLSFTLGVKAHPVDMRLARDIGAKFINTNTMMKVAPDRDLHWVTTYQTTNNDAAFHVFNTPKGFVIVAADDCATPILGYSEEGRFDVNNIPVQMRDYLQGFVEQIQYGIDRNLSADETISRQWERVKSTGRITEQRFTTAVAPLLTDSWGQGCYYNSLCPEDADGSCGHTVVGCAATAMSQIMRFWGYPTTGTGSHTYTPPGYPTQTADFGATTYDWSHMPNSLSSSSTSTQVNAVATLMWHCGVSIDMSYGPDGSGAYAEDVVTALLNYFNYSTDVIGLYKSNYSNAEWLSMVKNNLDLGRPVHYSGHNASGQGGHGFVCDGYDSNDMLHFNWGWYGSYNNYFALDALTPGGYDFSYSNFAIFNIHPNDSSGNTFQVTATVSPSYGGMVSGMGSFGCGDECTLTATPFNGYNFVNWTQNGMVVSSSAVYSFTVNADVDLVANFSDGLVGDGSTGTNDFLPSYSFYSYSLTQQIYTASELGESGDITGIAFYNGGAEKTRTYDFYLKTTTKSSFSSGTDWDTVSASDLVFSGSVTMAADGWTAVTLDTPFAYDGISNVVLVADDNTGVCTNSPHMSCRVFGVTSQAIQVSSDETNYDPYAPTSYSGTVLGEKNQLLVTKDTPAPTMQVFAEYYPDASDPQSPYVRVCWGTGLTDIQNFRVYRANCDGSGIQMIADSVTQNYYIDTDWTALAWGSYKYGVSTISVGRESAINWVESLPGYRAAWDLLDSYSCTSSYQYGVATDGQYIYHSAWSSSAGFMFAKYDMQGNFIETFDVEGCGYLRDLTYDGQYFYGGNTGSVLYCVDLANQTLISTTTTNCLAIRYCAYDPVRDGFWVGNWNTAIQLIDRSGAVLITGPMGTTFSGAAYYMDENQVEHVYFFAQPSNNALVYDYDVASNTLSSSYIFSVTDNLEGAAGTSGGCFIGEYMGKMAFFADVQQTPNMVGIFELKSVSSWSNCIEKQPAVQSITLVAGWNWFSTNLEITLNDLKTALVEALPGTTNISINSQSNGSTTYNGIRWRGSLTSLDVTQMYMVQVTAACQITLEGTPIDPAEHPVTIHSGSNWIAFPLGGSKALAEAFADFAVNGDMIISQNGTSTYNGSNWRGTLSTLVPGKGYIFKSAATGTRTFTFPVGAK